MFDLFRFDLPYAVTEQLEKKLATMRSSPLTAGALEELAAFQARHEIPQGVYQLLLGNAVVYVGKATDAKERLEQHYGKLCGRRNLKMKDVHFRCLLLDLNWSTSANEELLIEHYKQKDQCKWNSSGFGAKDVGRERDGTEPNWFDKHYPIDEDYPCDGIEDKETVGELLSKLKQQLPFIFRYKIEGPEACNEINLGGVPRTACSLIRCAVKVLGPKWQATVFRSHIILYKEQRTYPHGQSL